MRLDESNFKDYHVFNVSFDGLTDLHDYLISDPEVNTRIFRTQSSLDRDTDFYGESLDKSIEYLLGGYTKDLDNFLRTNDELMRNCLEETNEIVQTRSFYGGVALAPLVAAGVPDCMLRYERNQDLRVINIYYNLGYPAHTSTREIINRGLATIYMIQALEQKGYIVNFYAYELSYHSDEIVNIEIKLKSSSDLFFNLSKCYFPMRGKEFLRRILFRVLESTPVETDWSGGYGRPADRELVKKFYHASDDSLIVGTPDEMNIDGYNIYKDTKNLISVLKIKDEFDMKRLTKLGNKKG